MYTDGLTEAANQDGEEMGVERLIDYFNNSSPHSTKDFVHQALTCVAKFTGCTNQADDICMLGIFSPQHEDRQPSPAANGREGAMSFPDNHPEKI